MAKIKKSTDPVGSCWHCRFYIRPDLSFRLDAAIGSICIVDRDPSYYAVSHEPIPGELPVHPDDICAKFEIDPPPTQMHLRVMEKKEKKSNDHTR